MDKDLLLKALPELGKSSDRRLPLHTQAGITARTSTRFALVEAAGKSPREQLFRPRAGINLAQQNTSKRRLLQLTGVTRDFLEPLNRELAGGESYPMVVGLLSIGTGLVSGGAGIAFTLVTSAMDVQRQIQPVRAREGDEIWQVEQVGKTKGEIVHVEYFVLLDPHRAGSDSPNEWVIHEARRGVSP